MRTMKRSAVFRWGGSIGFSSLAGWGSLGVQDAVAVAVITELKFNRGDIQLRVSSNAASAKPAVLQSLYAWQRRCRLRRTQWR